MSAPQESSEPIIDSILHPSDFSAASEVAFAHALKAALIARSQLTVMHVSPGMTAEWTDFPGVRDTLARWGLVPQNSPRSVVPALGIDVRKVIAHDQNPVQSVLAFLRRHPTDLIVLATHQHEGHSRWLQHSIAEPIARQAGQMTLFIPHGVEGFVSRHDGAVSLRHILIPVAPIPRAARYDSGRAPGAAPAMPSRHLHNTVRGSPWGRPCGALSRSAGLAVDQHREVGQHH
jgi:nucleotide-binding universal stress UspA family protein